MPTINDVRSKLEKLGVKIHDNNSLSCCDPYFNWDSTSDCITIDDLLTLDDLEAILTWTRIHLNKPEPQPKKKSST